MQFLGAYKTENVSNPKIRACLLNLTQFRSVNIHPHIFPFLVSFSPLKAKNAYLFLKTEKIAFLCFFLLSKKPPTLVMQVGVIYLYALGLYAVLLVFFFGLEREVLGNSTMGHAASKHMFGNHL